MAVKKTKETIYIKNYIENLKIANINIRKFKGLFRYKDYAFTMRLAGGEIPILLEYAIIEEDGDVVKGKELYNKFLNIIEKLQTAKKSAFVLYPHKNNIKNAKSDK